MRSEPLYAILFLIFAFAASAFAQQKDSCTGLIDVKISGVEITKAAHIEAGGTEPIPWSQSRTAPLPGYCQVDGVIHRRTGVGGDEFGITFALAMPDKLEWRLPDARWRWQQRCRDSATWIECRRRHAWTHSRICRREYGYRSQEPPSRDLISGS